MIDGPMVLFVVAMLAAFLAVELRQAIYHGVCNFLRVMIGGVIAPPLHKKNDWIELDKRIWKGTKK